jgi:Fe2+ or Zn2+ uptake regulation protein
LDNVQTGVRGEGDLDRSAAVTQVERGEVAGRFHQAGLRLTHTRSAVYEQLAKLGGHRGADEVYEALIARKEHISRTTVYSTLDVLARLGLVMAADAGPGRALYEAKSEWHHHAVCRVCGQVSDVDCVVGAKPCLEPSWRWGEVDEAQVIFRGVCRACASKKTRRGGSRTGSRTEAKTKHRKSKSDRKH